jgi:hypothetical protein
MRDPRQRSLKSREIRALRSTIRNGARWYGHQNRADWNGDDGWDPLPAAFPDLSIAPHGKT